MASALAPVAPANNDYVSITATPDDAHWLGTELMEVLVSSAQSNGKYDVVRGTIPPGGGPPPHRHSREDELFYVVAGTFKFVRDNEFFTATAGTLVWLPRGTVHTFQNVGDTAGTLIVFSTPSGFADFVADAGFPAVDRVNPPPVTAATLDVLMGGCETYGIEMLPTHVASREIAPPAFIHDLWVTGLQVRILAGNEQTNNQFAVAEITAHPGDFVPPHTHDPEDEMFYVLEGEVEFDIPGSPVTATAGTLVHIPRGVFHGFRNASDADAKMLDLHTPGGFERFFAEAGTPWPDLSVNPPPSAWVDVPRFIRIANAHGMEVAKP